MAAPYPRLWSRAYNGARPDGAVETGHRGATSNAMAVGGERVNQPWSTPFVGRHRELSDLIHRLDDAEQGRGSIVLLAHTRADYAAALLTGRATGRRDRRVS